MLPAAPDAATLRWAVPASADRGPVDIAEDTVIEPNEKLYVQSYYPTAAAMVTVSHYGAATISNDD